jgi:hypothetical protein
MYRNKKTPFMPKKHGSFSHNPSQLHNLALTPISPLACCSDNSNSIVLLSEQQGSFVYQIRYYLNRNEVYLVIINTCAPDCNQYIPLTRSNINICSSNPCEQSSNSCKPCDPCIPKDDCYPWVYKCEFNKKEVYCLNNIVHMSCACPPGLYIYLSNIPSKPNCCDLACWKLLLQDCCHNETPCPSPCPPPCNPSNPTNMCCYLGEWDCKIHYECGNIVKHDGCLFICKQSCTSIKPSACDTNCSHWDVIFCGFKHCGTHCKEKSYQPNCMVRHDCSTYISIKCVPKNICIDNCEYWKLLVKDCTCKNTKCKSNKSTDDCDKCDPPFDMGSVDCMVDYCLGQTKQWNYDDDSFDFKAPRKKYDKYDLEKPDIDFDDTRDRNRESRESTDNQSQLDLDLECESNSYICSLARIHHAVLSRDLKCTTTSKKPKTIHPLVFDKVIHTDAIYETMDSHIILTKPGFYKVTCHIVYKHTNYFKLQSYLLTPYDNFKDASFIKDKVIPASKINHLGSSKIKNYLHYTFPVRVSHPMSTLTITSIRKNKLCSEYDLGDKDVIIYGQGKTWIMIEYMD